MENRTAIMRWIFTFTLLFFFPHISFAYIPETTHAGLTQEIVNFFNLNSDRKISPEFKELVIYGAIEEDSPEARVLNHFYDPVLDMGLNNFDSAKYWATHESGSLGQLDLSFQIGSKKRKAGGELNKYTWAKSLEYYAKGDEANAHIGLGHILHLLEDMGVPEHTRNDPHMGEGADGLFTNISPYENWAGETKSRDTLVGLAKEMTAPGKRVNRFQTLEDYFNFLAGYSNRNFFSLDTVENPIYQYPEPKILEVSGKYAYAIDSISGDKSKILLFVGKEGEKIYKLIDDQDTSVVEDYFNRLSTQIILNGAGVVELFFKEGEEARKKYREEEKQKQKELQAKIELESKLLALRENNRGLKKISPFIQYVWEFNVKEGIWNVATKVRDVSDTLAVNIQNGLHTGGNLARAGTFVAKTAVQIGEIFVKEKAGEAKENVVVFVQKKLPVLAEEFRNQEASPLPIPAILVEVLPNTADIPKTEPQKAEPIPIPLPASNPGFTIIPGFGGGSAPAPIIPSVSPPDAPADLAVETPSEIPEEPLPRAPEIIPDTTAPDIGFSVSECVHTLSVDSAQCLLSSGNVHALWETHATDTTQFSLFLDGTLQGTSTAVEADISLVPGEHELFVVAADFSGNNATSTPVSIIVFPNPVVISEVGWSGTASSSANEWIELFNHSAYSIKLDEVTLRAEDDSPIIPLLGTVAPGAYYLIERTDDDAVPGITADFTSLFSGNGLSFGLSNTGEVLLLVHEVAGFQESVLDKTPDLSWCGGWCGGFATIHTTMARIDPGASGADRLSWGNGVFKSETVFAATGATIYGTPKSENTFFDENAGGSF